MSTGLSVHMNQVHKESLDQVENALPNRQGLDIEIFGMEGIPPEVLDTHRQRLIQNFYQAQEDRRLATGNPLPGQQIQRKTIKIETAEELKARLAEWRVKKKAGGVDAMEGVVPTSVRSIQASGQRRRSVKTKMGSLTFLIAAAVHGLLSASLSPTTTAGGCRNAPGR